MKKHFFQPAICHVFFFFCEGAVIEGRAQNGQNFIAVCP